MSNNVLKNYKYVREYDTSNYLSDTLVNNLLQQAWKVTPSKNNFMPYSVFVVGPDQQHLKDNVYKLCVKNESKANNIPDISIVRQYNKTKPQYWNIVSCSHLLIFVPRVETVANPWQNACIQKGNVYDQMSEENMWKVRNISSIEIGMFSTIFATLCLEHGFDISHTMCFSDDVADWQESGFKDIKYPPILLMSTGKGIAYRQPVMDPIEKLDLKPDYSRIVNFVK
jgi:hypothetical protein